MTTMTHDGIVEREKAIYDHCIENRKDPVWAIAQDRLKRWTKYLEEYPPSDDVKAWAGAMEAKYGAQCRFWNNTVGWIMALLICRYGEAEYHWPADGTFTIGDMGRAAELLNGRFPEELITIV